MGKKIKIPYQGSEIDGEDLEFTTEKEEWNIYKTEDGSIIKIKTIVSRIVRTEVYNDNTGEPLYVISSTPSIFADVSMNVLRKVPKKSKK